MTYNDEKIIELEIKIREEEKKRYINKQESYLKILQNENRPTLKERIKQIIKGVI